MGRINSDNVNRRLDSHSDSYGLRFKTKAVTKPNSGAQTINVGTYQWHGNGASESLISEIIYFKESLDDADITKINYYLSNKWGLKHIVDSDYDGAVDNVDFLPLDPYIQ